MATPITSNALNFTASGAAASINSVNGATGETRFSDLLRGQILNGASARASGMEFPTRMNAANATSAHAAQATREPERTASPADRPRTRAAAREPERAGKSANSNPPARETGQSTAKKTQKASDTHRAERPEATEEHAQNALNPRDSTSEVADNASRTQDSAANARIDPGIATTPAATIAALLGGIAVEANADVDAETAADHGASDTLHAERLNPLLAQTGDDAAESTEEDETDTGGTGTPRYQGATSADESAPHGRAAAAAKTGGDAATPIHIAAGATLNSAAASGAHAEMLAARAQGAALNAANASNAANAANATNSTNATNTNTNAMPLLNMPRLAGQPGASALQFSIPAGMGQSAWAEEVGNRVMWMLGRAESRAELLLTPPNLGKVEVSINLNGDHGTAQFLASSQAARDALEQAMPRLRELLAQAGISLGEASVNTSSESQPRSEEESGARHGHAAGHAGSNEGGHDDATPVTSANWTRLDNGLVNTFA